MANKRKTRQHSSSRNPLSASSYVKLEAREMLAGDSTFYLEPATSTLFVTAGESNITGAEYANEMYFRVDAVTGELVVTEANRGERRYNPGDVTAIDYRGTPLADHFSNESSIGTRVVTYDGNDLIESGNGNDVVLGGNDNDTIYPGQGDDFANGGRGDDLIQETGDLSGADRLFGAAGVDEIYSGSGDDLVIGHQGNDIINSGDGDDIVFGGDDDDNINSGSGDDFVAGQDGNDTVNTEDGNDILLGNAGDDILNGGDGDDVIYAGDGADESYGGLGIDRIVGSLGNDLIHGGEGDDSLDGGDGDDTIYGAGGNDVIFGQNGNDILVGGDGLDHVYAAIENVLNDSSGVDEIRTIGDSVADVIVAHPNDTILSDSIDSFADTNLARLNTQAQFMIDNLSNDGWAVTASGLQYNSILEGTGATPSLFDTVRVDYTGTFIEGTEFDANDNISFQLFRVIRGWQEGLQLMKEGGIMDFAIPADLAYGDSDRTGIPGGSVLMFRVQLHEVVV